MSAKKIDTLAWISLGLLLFLTSLSIYYYSLFTDDPGISAILVAVAFMPLLWLAGKVRAYAPKLTDAAFALVVSAYLYKLWPHMFFDDAGFILRYLDQLEHGYWFSYNAGEAPVFGISGFLHGLYSSLLVKGVGMTPERALHVSNLTGLAGVLFFLAGIFRYYVHKPGWAYTAAFIVACFTKTWADVLFTGMETPLHVAFILGALYFWLYGHTRWFYLFAALSVISKLDAVPVMAVLLLIHGMEVGRKEGFKNALAGEWKPLFLWFGLPLAAWVGFAYWFFGSPFPQSAKAKVLYHRAASDEFFPFLNGFVHDMYKHPMLFLFLAFLFIHILLVKRKGVTAITRHFVFGWMFAAIMLLYFFYKPNERMLWYYALPDLLLTAQCILSGIWMASETKDWKKHALPGFVLLAWLLYLVPDVNGARHWMFAYLEKVEQERYEIGKYIAPRVTADDTLLAWHGLIARPFPGYVLDGTGLNSPKALELGINRDRMLQEIRPRYAVHHAYKDIMASFEKYGYRIKGIFGDITLENWPAWIWWEHRSDGKTTPDSQNRYLSLTDSMVLTGKIMHEGYPLRVEGRRVVFALSPEMRTGTCWLVFEGRKQTTATVHLNVWSDATLMMEQDIELPPYGQPGYPSLYTFGTGIPFHGSDSAQTVRLEFLPTGADTAVKINNPIVEYSTYHP